MFYLSIDLQLYIYKYIYTCFLNISIYIYIFFIYMLYFSITCIRLLEVKQCGTSYWLLFYPGTPGDLGTEKW